MKLSAGQIPGFLARPPETVRAVLVYGPDGGLVRERAERLAAAVVSDPSDPFLTENLQADEVRRSPARLAEAAAALALGGGRRLVRLRDADDSIAAAFGDFLKDPPGTAMVVVTAGDLPARSPLRKQFEAAGNSAAALPCYSDDSGSLRQLISQVLAEGGVTAPDPVVLWLETHLGADRGASRMELEKLRLYAGPGATLTLEDALACTGDAAAIGLEDAVMAAAEGNAAALDLALERLWADGVSPVAPLRAAANHVMRLQQALAARGRGQSADQAVQGLRPPVFWKAVPRFKTQLGFWDRELGAAALATLLEAETAVKRSGTPAVSLAGWALHRVAALARQRQQRR